MNFFNKKLNKFSQADQDNFINPKVLEVNLVKDEVGVEFDWSRHLLSFFLVLFFAAMLVVEVYYGLDWWQKQEEQKTEALNNDYNVVVRQIKNINAKSTEVNNFKEKLALTQRIADNHVYYTNFFSWLEKNTLNTVTYGGFSGDTSGDYNLSATAKTFSDISWQVKNFKDNAFVESVSVGNGTSNRGDTSTSTDTSVTFSIKLKVKPEIFFRKAE
jgi:hypothetical protein